MKKNLLERYISKYNLAGIAESVVIESDGTNLTTKFISDDKSLIGSVVGNEFGIDAGAYPLYNTSQFKSYLSVLDEDIKVNVQKKENKPYAFQIFDTATKMHYILANLAVIPKAPSMKADINFDLSFAIDEKFMNTFVKAKGAMGDSAETFTIHSNGKKEVRVVLGDAGQNADTNVISLNIEVEHAAKMEPLSFKSSYLREIFLANKDNKTGKMSISSQGLAKIEFTGAEFETTYALVRVEIEQ